MKKLFTLYNQWLEYFTRNACSIYIWFHIFQVMFWIRVNNEYLVAASREAEKDEAWWSWWWTYADTIANWFVREIYERFNVISYIRIHSWYSDKFEKNLKDWYAYGIWLKYAWRLYRKIKEDNTIKITELDVDLKGHPVYWHFLTYFYSKITNKFYILDSLKHSRKPIEMDIEVFRKWIDKWIFFINCRTIELENTRLDYYLKFFRDWWVIKNMEELSILERMAADKALELRSLSI